MHQSHFAAWVDKVGSSDGYGPALQIEVTQVYHTIGGGYSTRLIGEKGKMYMVAGHVSDVLEPLSMVVGRTGREA